MSASLLGVEAAVGVLGVLDASGDANTVLVTTGVRNASVGPNRPGAVDAVGASEEIVASELKVSVLHGPALALGVLGGGLSTSSVSDDSLAC